ncbi:GCN5-related N-acetyltransferase [Oscillatoria nigro-viridis PCC 7112]|uniref:GCN5-related N-acetyltransferase n=1 Tax=Phormidium nigroviride PCC 7112 TaxID=179408 RepID=K9VE37_9CYAN|nr:GNAT family N-acetyltransferase [Oscillatoria nigro-viridis]AFZ05500.1 GCN5-related N-acetyltransferase [Oscillatoria nigro-viridis PCC 7112]
MDFLIAPIDRIERSTSSLKKEPFNSGNPELDRYFKQYAQKNDRDGIAKTFVAFSSGGSQIIGYYSCCAGVVEREDLPADLRQRLPRYPIPAILIAKLAVDRSMQGRGLGKQLLLHALARAIDVSEIVGVYGVRVDAIDEKAKEFYQKFGFLECQETALSLFMLMNTIKQAANVKPSDPTAT